jgi:hypothetical protein
MHLPRQMEKKSWTKSPLHRRYIGGPAAIPNIPIFFKCNPDKIAQNHEPPPVDWRCNADFKQE